LECNSLTYDQLLIAMEDLIPAMAKHLHIRHILTDECQDYTPRQWQIVNKMVEAFGASLFAVGDIDQSIFSFRNADPGYLIEHQSEFDVLQLQTNYRSVPEIVEPANKLISNNSERIGGTMRASREDHGSVTLKTNADSGGLASFVQGAVVAEDWAKSTAVLSRVHALLAKLSTELTERGIDHTYIGKKTALTNSEDFRRFHAFLKLLVNDKDNFSFLLIKDLIGLSAEDYTEIRVKGAREGLSHFEAWTAYQDDNNVDISFFHAVHEWTLHDLAGNLESVLNDPYQDQDPWSPQFDFKPSLDFVWEWCTQNPTGTIKQYLDWLATFDLQDEMTEEQEGLVLTTIHGAKGLEWPTVILIGANEGILPSKQAIKSDEIEEERRLMYVAATRARDHLIIAVRPETKEIDGKIYQNPASRFVQEATT
jgi:DNA helicase-2/ATP-dependent DNA helicase PcrA